MNKDQYNSRLTPIETESFQEQAYRKLADALMKGDLAPGEVVSLRGIAEQLGTSAMPVREAVRQLISERALEMRSTRTMVVPVLSRARLEELRKLRTILEGAIAAESAALISNDDILELHSLNDEMRSAVKRRDARRYARKNQAFHFILYRGSQMGVAVEIIERLWLQMGPSFNLLLSGQSSGWSEESGKFLLAHHDALISALERRDPEAVRQALAGDIADGIQFLIDQAEP